MYTAKLHVDDLQYEQRPYNGVQAYAETKRAEVVLTQIWAHKLADTNIFVAAMHPGWANTKSVQKSLPLFQAVMRPLLRSPAQGADTIVWLAANPHLGKAESGRFWFDRKTRSFHRLGTTRNTPQEIQQFWQTCCTLTGYEEP
jgi:NAD(P)-dependent dehydrogenase (short-subunit alcohol dehydrogenase family)